MLLRQNSCSTHIAVLSHSFVFRRELYQCLREILSLPNARFLARELRIAYGIIAHVTFPPNQPRLKIEIFTRGLCTRSANNYINEAFTNTRIYCKKSCLMRLATPNIAVVTKVFRIHSSYKSPLSYH